jgi:hypothetical protein
MSRPAGMKMKAEEAYAAYLAAIKRDILKPIEQSDDSEQNKLFRSSKVRRE